MIERFMNKVELIPFHTCWEWTASKHMFGYGWFNVNRKCQVAHRVSYELFKGPITNNMHVLHSCDNPGCVNPDHLRLGNDRDNTKDKVSKNRQAKGVDNGGKLSNEDVINIRKEYAQGGISLLKLAKKYNSSSTAIQFIIQRKTWRHL